MTDRRLFVSWSMDCETVQEESSATGGAADWVVAERAMRGYVQSLTARGQRVTLFLVPRLAEARPQVVRDLVAGGAEPGLHVHPQTSDLGYEAHLGQLPLATQRLLIEQGRDRVAAVAGSAPTSFRSGCLSGSWEIFPMLLELGFMQGSTTMPGRNLPAVGAVWVNDPPFANWREGGFGRRFLELPVGGALEELGPHREAPCSPRHLRLEYEGIAEWGPGLIREYVRRQVELGWWLKSLGVMTHNTRCYDDPAEPARRNLELIADAIEATAEEFGLEVVPATLAEVRAATTR